MKFVKRVTVADWSLPREDLSRRRREGFRPPAHERATGPIARLKAAARRRADLQFGSIWRDLAALLPQVRGTLADVGSGAQPFRDMVPAGVHYIAVDIAEAETQFGYRTADTRYYSGEILPLVDGEADAVLCTETLEHVLHPELFLKELARVLAHRGHLILTVPFSARWHLYLTTTGATHPPDSGIYYPPRDSMKYAFMPVVVHWRSRLTKHWVTCCCCSRDMGAGA